MARRNEKKVGGAITEDDHARRRLMRRRNPKVLVLVLALVGTNTSFLQTLVLPMQGQLPDLLQTGADDATWVITATLLGSATFTPVAGRLGDLYGKRRVILLLLVLLTIGSIICAVSSSLIPMIIGRALQGTSLGVVPLGISVLRDVMPVKHLSSAVGLVSATLGGGAALGFPLGAVIVENLDWHWIFWLATIFGVMSLLAVIVFIPGSVLRNEGNIDIPGAIGLMLALSGILVAISKGNAWGWSSPLTLSFGIFGIGLLLLWSLHQMRQISPLVDLRVSARPAVLFTNLASIAMSFSLFSSSVAVPQLLELPAPTGLGLTMLAASLALMPSGIMMMALSPFSGILANRIGARRVLLIGALFIVLSYVLLLFLRGEVWQIVAALTVSGMGVGLGYASLPTLIMQAVPSSETASANSLNALMRSLGTTLASAVIGAVLAAISTTAADTTTPTAVAFEISFVIALCAAATCVALAIAIPRRQGDFGHTSLPADLGD